MGKKGGNDTPWGKKTKVNGHTKCKQSKGTSKKKDSRSKMVGGEVVVAQDSTRLTGLGGEGEKIEKIVVSCDLESGGMSFEAVNFVWAWGGLKNVSWRRSGFIRDNERGVKRQKINRRVGHTNQLG